MTKDPTPSPTGSANQRDEKPTRFIDPRETRRTPPSLRTAEEARLAAEIEKLRG